MLLASASLSLFPWRLVYLQDLIRYHVLERLSDAAGPVNLDRLGDLLRPQAKMHPLVAGGQITCSGRYDGKLRAFRGSNFYLRPDRIPVAFMSDEQQREPVVLRGSLVVQDVCGSIIGGNDRVQPTDIIQVADRHTPSRPRLLKDLSRVRRHIHETVACVSRQQHRFAIAQVRRSQLNRIQIVALSNQKILPAIIVVIQKPNSPAGMGTSDRTYAGRIAGIVERAVAVVPKQGIHLIGEVGNDQVWQAIVVVVGKVDSHASERTAVAIYGSIAH